MKDMDKYTRAVKTADIMDNVKDTLKYGRCVSQSKLDSYKMFLMVSPIFVDMNNYPMMRLSVEAYELYEKLEKEYYA
jgi:hypothetical protein